VFSKHLNYCTKEGGCAALRTAILPDFDVKKYLQELRRTLPYVPPIPTAALKSLHKAQDYKGMVKLIKRAMNIEDVTFLVVWVPDGAEKTGKHKDAAAWVNLPNEMPSYGTKAFKEMTIKMFFRRSFIEQAYDETAVAIAHELSHVVLESIRHPLRRCEKVVDLTAMLLGFRNLYASGSHKERHFGNRVSIRSIGYLRQEEIDRANRFLAQGDERPTTKTTYTQHTTTFGAVAILIAGMVIWAIFGTAFTGTPGTDHAARRQCIELQHQPGRTNAQINTFCNCYSEEIKSSAKEVVPASLQETINLITQRCNHEAYGE
jgi:hypothetical protein